MTNEEIFGTLLPNIYLDDIAVTGDLVSLRVEVFYSILEASNSDGVNWTTLPPVVLNNLKIVVGLLKNNNDSYNERKIFSNFRNIRQPQFVREQNVSSLRQIARSSIVSTFPVQSEGSDLALPILESQPDLYKDSLIKKYSNSEIFNSIPRADLNNLDFYAYVFYDPPQSFGIQPIYGNLTKYKIFQNKIFKPEVLTYNVIESGNEFFGLTLVKQNNNFLTSSVVDYSNENIELTESYVPFNQHSKKVKDITIVDKTQITSIENIVLDSKYTNKVSDAVELPNYTSEIFINPVSNLPPLQYLKSTTRSNLNLEGYLFIDADRLVKNRSFYPDFFTPQNPFLFKKENISITFKKSNVPKGVSDDSFLMNILNVTQIINNNKKLYKIKFNFDSPTAIKNKKGIYESEISISIPDPVIKILTDNKQTTNIFLNSLNSFKTNLELVLINSSLSEQQKKLSINNNLASLNLSLNNFLDLMINLGIDIDKPITGYESASASDIANFYSVRAITSDIFNKATNANSVNVNNLQLLIDLTSKISVLYNRTITTGDKPAVIEYKKVYPNILDFSLLNDNNILLLNEKVTIGKHILTPSNEKLVISSLPDFYNINNLNNHLARYFNDDVSAAGNVDLPKFNDEQKEFINILSKIAPQFLDLSTDVKKVTGVSNEIKVMYENYFRAKNKIFASNLTSVYINFISNILYKKEYLLGFKNVIGYEFFDMNSPIWVNRYNGKEVFLTKIEKYNDFPQKNYSNALEYDSSLTKFSEVLIMSKYSEQAEEEPLDENPSNSIADIISARIQEQLQIEKQQQAAAEQQAKAAAAQATQFAALRAQQQADELKKQQDLERSKQAEKESAKQAEYEASLNVNISSPDPKIGNVNISSPDPKIGSDITSSDIASIINSTQQSTKASSLKGKKK